MLQEITTPTKDLTETDKDPFDSDITAVADAVLKTKRPSTDDLFKKAKEMGVDPFEILLQIADGNKLALGLDDEEDRPITPELRAMASREILKYMYPTMKSTELTGKDGAPLVPFAIKVMFEGDDTDQPTRPKEIV